jgi:hypothetical protein
MVTSAVRFPAASRRLIHYLNFPNLSAFSSPLYLIPEKASNVDYLYAASVLDQEDHPAQGDQG